MMITPGAMNLDPRSTRGCRPGLSTPSWPFWITPRELQHPRLHSCSWEWQSWQGTNMLLHVKNNRMIQIQTWPHSLRRAGGNPCYLFFSREHFETMRMQYVELLRRELNLVILGQISALLSNYPNTKSNRQATPRQRSSMAFYHCGVRVCRITFQKLHGIGVSLSAHECKLLLHVCTIQARIASWR